MPWYEKKQSQSLQEMFNALIEVSGRCADLFVSQEKLPTNEHIVYISGLCHEEIYTLLRQEELELKRNIVKTAINIYHIQMQCLSARQGRVVYNEQKCIDEISDLIDGVCRIKHQFTYTGDKPYVYKKSDTISQEEFSDILNRYKSRSLLGWLSTFWLLSWIAPTRSQTMVELKALVNKHEHDHQAISYTEVHKAIERGNNSTRRLGLFDEVQKEAVNGTCTDDIIAELTNAFYNKP